MSIINRNQRISKLLSSFNNKWEAMLFKDEAEFLSNLGYAKINHTVPPIRGKLLCKLTYIGKENLNNEYEGFKENIHASLSKVRDTAEVKIIYNNTINNYGHIENTNINQSDYSTKKNGNINPKGDDNTKFLKRIWLFLKTNILSLIF